MTLNLLLESCYNCFEFVEQLENNHTVCNRDFMDIFFHVLPVFPPTLPGNLSLTNCK